jgi:hypothetical protein
VRHEFREMSPPPAEPDARAIAASPAIIEYPMKYSNDPALLLALATACVPVELRLRPPDLVPG